MSKMNNQVKIRQSYNEVGVAGRDVKKCVDEEGLNHEGPYSVEEAQYINGNRSYNFKPNNNLPNHYTPALRNHENLSYGGGM